LSGKDSIDLHPDRIPGSGPEAALMACRNFLDKALAAGHRRVRIITGLGLRGDGTPRLRSRVEQEVLPGYLSRIEQTGYEQGGAVIVVWFKPGGGKPSAAWTRHERRHVERRDLADREERFMVGWERLEAAQTALEEGDLRRCRLKLNQVAKEFGFEPAEGPLSGEAAGRLLDAHWSGLEALDSK
jgi:Smr domain